MCRNANLQAGLDVALLARLTPGYVGSDLDSLMEAAASNADERQCRDPLHGCCHLQLSILS